jgi:hypothetical protein
MSNDFAIEVTSETEGSDYRWARSNHGLDAGVTGTLDLANAKGILGTKSDLGKVPSGVGVGVITTTGRYGLFDPAATDGRQVLAGFIVQDVNVQNAKGAVQASGKAPFALLTHGIINRKFLPVEAQRTSITYLTESTGQFVYVD